MILADTKSCRDTSSLLKTHLLLLVPSLLIGSCGIHLEMGASNKRALKFYQKMGFAVLNFEENPLDGIPPKDALILGMVL